MLVLVAIYDRVCTRSRDRALIIPGLIGATDMSVAFTFKTMGHLHATTVTHHGPDNKLKRGLSTRHIRFMALGSAIGTGLFYGSADAIKMAGPSVLLAYLIGGIVAFIIMRALGRCRSTTRRPARFPATRRTTSARWRVTSPAGPTALKS